MLGPHPFQKCVTVKRLGRPGLFSGNQRIPQGFHLRLVFLQKPQSRPDHVAGRTVATGPHLRLNEFRKMIAKGNGRIARHFKLPINKPLRQMYQILVMVKSAPLQTLGSNCHPIIIAIRDVRLFGVNGPGRGRSD
tara:strand:- start:289 stop:693 length:405 start_codon:yes stop_codon:yes gene_type:complete